MPSTRRRTIRALIYLLLTSSLVLGLPSLVRAQGTGAADAPGWSGGDWHFNVGVYGWLESVHGNLTSPAGAEIPFDIPLSEILPYVETAVEAVAELGWRRWFFVFDGTWVTLAGDYQGALFDLDLEFKQELYDLHLGYGVIRKRWAAETPPGKEPWARYSILDAMVGARYFGTEVGIDQTSHLTGNTTHHETGTGRWDPFLGARGSHSLGNRWAVNLSLDIGGFSIGDAAKFTYQADGNFGFRISHPLTVYLGYRVLGYDLADDSGGSAQIVQYGPKVGAALTF